jgi:TnpA family transposase
MARKNRITLLSDKEISDTYDRPIFCDELRSLYFSLSKAENETLSAYKTTNMKIYFILQHGYFKAKQQFFKFTLDEVKEDIHYISSKYFNATDIATLKIPYRENINKQQKEILNIHGFRKWDNAFVSGTTIKIGDLLKRYPKGSDTFCQLQKYLENEKIVIPTYRTCQDMFTEAFAIEESRLSLLVNEMPKDIQDKLGSLISNTKDNKDNGIIKLSIIKQDQKDFNYTAFTQEIEKAKGIADLYLFSKTFLSTSELATNTIRYYADITENYPVSRLRKLNANLQKFYTLCFIYHRYQQFMDNLVISFRYHVQLILDGGKARAEVAFMQHAASLSLDFPKLAKFLKWFPKGEDNKGATFEEFSQKAYEILPKDQFEIMADYLEGNIFDKSASKWDFYKASSGAYSRYMRPIILTVDLMAATDARCTKLLQLIDVLKIHYSKGKTPKQLKISDDMGLTIEKSMLPYLKNHPDDELLDPYRFEFYVYQKISHHINKGRLVCNESISFRDLENDLVSDKMVDDVEEISKKYGYPKIPIFCKQRLDDALIELDETWDVTLENIANGENQDIKITEDENGNLKWSLLYDAKDDLENSFFSNLPKIEIADLIKFVGDSVELWDAFTHLKHKYIKHEKPLVLAINACLLSESFGFGIKHMSEICDLNFNTLNSTKMDFFRVETLMDANDALSNSINKLPIFREWDLLEGKLLADADGRKNATTKSTIQSRYSTKYLGKGPGLSIYSLVANHVVVNAKNIGLNEYEGHGLYDIVQGNKSDVPIDYITGDNHSLNPLNFVVLDSVDISYVPSIKNIAGAAEKLYSRKPISDYSGIITPVGVINDKLIKSQNRKIIRVLLSLILQENTQTTIIRKLSSHDRYARLRTALYEYNKIFKSIHVLNMINDVKLRKAIRTARNRTEAYHQLQRMIRKVYHGVFKGKKIVNNDVSMHAARLIANCIIYYNTRMLDTLHTKLKAAGASKEVLNYFIRISPVSWSHIAFTGRYSFAKTEKIIDLESLIKALEEKLKKTLWLKDL